MKPARSKSRRCDDRRPLAHAADHAAAIDALEQAVEIGIVPGIVAHDGVFDRDGDAVVDQARDRVEARLLCSEPKPSSDFR